MVNTSFSWDLFNKIPIIGIMRNLPSEKMVTVTSLFEKSGFTNLEITLNSPKAFASIAELSKSFGDKINVGAGTVCSIEQLDLALSAGASFIVTPIVNEEIIRKCNFLKIPVFPGAFTPTEIYKADALGAAMVKVFPASQLGPKYVKELLAPFPQIKLLPTGGISIENMRAFMDAGAKGLGIGSQLFPIDTIQHAKWEDLRKLFARVLKQWTESFIEG